MELQFEQIYTNMLPAIESKMTEFHLYGYTTVTEVDIWTYCVQKKWRNKDVSSMRTYEIANDILQLLPAAFMTFIQIEAQRSSDWFSDLNSDELQNLLKKEKPRTNKL
ncbi:post-transcriptional regulator [Sporosarcina sp. G11-34]|uniref:post-transcriptional regulator n=1 Tax=Sporosarcina sp. G11-34 TaxID=2849605 RepID=UPI0022A92CB3|nr:post-transcriptional regulator [Sporosarcina sp. G11-34]MCZ2258389.1 post-transcriptional regulator [Sporosarcina sp. G11-34]